eukprot:TRINITY_DN343_c0_g2_i1.p1 TRINITY_DN343_c0_g2~~TRINITY_DN343_c0_g2_i1.p1  ORF type:complete len:397 (-),score=107.82 TRINITY_DN343_c0_g2_i1:33-1175(-)
MQKLVAFLALFFVCSGLLCVSAQADEDVNGGEVSFSLDHLMDEQETENFFEEDLNQEQESDSAVEADNSQVKAETSQVEADNSQVEADNSQVEADNSQVEADNSQVEADNSQAEVDNSQVEADSQTDDSEVEAEGSEGVEQNSEYSEYDFDDDDDDRRGRRRRRRDDSQRTIDVSTNSQNPSDLGLLIDVSPDNERVSRLVQGAPIQVATAPIQVATAPIQVATAAPARTCQTCPAAPRVQFVTASAPLWDNPLSGSSWREVVSLRLNLTRRSIVKLHGNGHGFSSSAGQAVDVNFFVNNRICGIHGLDSSPSSPGNHQAGTSLNTGSAAFHSTMWIPFQVVGLVTLDAGQHQVGLRARCRPHGRGHVNGLGIIAEVHPL